MPNADSSPVSKGEEPTELEALRDALKRAMVLLVDAEEKLSFGEGEEGLLSALFDSDDGFALEFFNTRVAVEEADD